MGLKTSELKSFVEIVKKSYTLATPLEDKLLWHEGEIIVIKIGDLYPYSILNLFDIIILIIFIISILVGLEESVSDHEVAGSIPGTSTILNVY